MLASFIYENIISEILNSEKSKNKKIEDIIHSGYIPQLSLSLSSIHIISKRLEYEINLLEKLNILFNISFQPLYQKKYGSIVLLQISFEICDHNLFIFITSQYPFQEPIIYIDSLKNSYKKYRVQDGLENSKIGFLYEYISEFIEKKTEIEDLELFKFWFEKNSIYDEDEKFIYLNKISKYYNPSTHLFSIYNMLHSYLYDIENFV